MSGSDTSLYVDLASERRGTRVLESNDEFFAPKENLIAEAEPVWKPDEYTSRGKWMDGWETRRRREPGHDWALLHLGVPGIVRHVVIDTSHFTGNFPESASVEAIELHGDHDIVELVRDPARWREIVPRSTLRGDAHNEFPVNDAQPSTHIRLVIYPDGGVARLRLLGDPIPPEGGLRSDKDTDLAAIHNGARAIDCSDRHYSSPNRMLLPGSAKGMWEGWETRRRRQPGHDWAIVRLAGPGVISRLELDTTHFKGNAPGSADVEAIHAPGATPDHLAAAAWATLLPETPLQPDKKHVFDDLADVGEATHLRLNIHPDGGMARFRVWGRSDTPWTSNS